MSHQSEIDLYGVGQDPFLGRRVNVNEWLRPGVIMELKPDPTGLFSGYCTVFLTDTEEVWDNVLMSFPYVGTQEFLGMMPVGGKRTQSSSDEATEGTPGGVSGVTTLVGTGVMVGFFSPNRPVIVCYVVSPFSVFLTGRLNADLEPGDVLMRGRELPHPVTPNESGGATRIQISANGITVLKLYDFLLANDPENFVITINSNRDVTVFNAKDWTFSTTGKVDQSTTDEWSQVSDKKMQLKSLLDEIQIIAQKKLTITSSTDEMFVSSQKKMTLTSQDEVEIDSVKKMSLISQDEMQLTASKNVKLNATEDVVFQSGTKKVARVDDQTESSSSVDSAWWSWIQQLVLWASTHTHGTGVGPSTPSLSPPPSAPSTLTSKITQGAAKVKA